jgi:hypothetical protein
MEKRAAALEEWRIAGTWFPAGNKNKKGRLCALLSQAGLTGGEVVFT